MDLSNIGMVLRLERRERFIGLRIGALQNYPAGVDRIDIARRNQDVGTSRIPVNGEVFGERGFAFGKNSAYVADTGFATEYGSAGV